MKKREPSIPVRIDTDTYDRALAMAAEMPGPPSRAVREALAVCVLLVERVLATCGEELREDEIEVRDESSLDEMYTRAIVRRYMRHLPRAPREDVDPFAAEIAEETGQSPQDVQGFACEVLREVMATIGRAGLAPREPTAQTPHRLLGLYMQACLRIVSEAPHTAPRLRAEA